MQFRLKRFYYEYMKEAVEYPNRRVYRIKNLIAVIFLFQMVLRILLSIVTYKQQNGGVGWFVDYWRLDPFSNYIWAKNPELYVHYLMMIMLLHSLGILGTYLFNFWPTNTLSFQIQYDIAVVNVDQYQQCLRSPGDQQRLLQAAYHRSIARIQDDGCCWSMKVFVRTPLVRRVVQLIFWLKTKLKFYSNFHHVNQRKLAHYKLSTIPEASARCRSMLALTVTVLDRIYYYYHVFLIFVLIMLLKDYCLFVHEDGYTSESNRWWFGWIYGFLLAEILVNIYNFYQLLQCGLICMSFCLMATLYNWYMVKMLNRQLKRISIQCGGMIRKSLDIQPDPGQTTTSRTTTTTTTSHLLPLLFVRKLRRIYKLHNHLCHLYHYRYNEIWSKALLAFFIISLPFNVMCVLELRSDQLTLDEVFSNHAIWIIHSTVMVVVLLTMAWQTDLLHKAKKILVSIVQSINAGSSLSLKLKYDDWFHRLTFGPKYGPFIATIGSITYLTVFNIVIIYIGIFMLIMDNLQGIYY